MFSEVHFMAPDAGVIISGILACLLLIASGFASGSEIAFFSLTPNDLSIIAEKKSVSDSNIMQLLND